MNPSEGRRTQVSATGRRTLLFSGVLVALTAGMLTLAGTTPREIGRPVDDPSRVQLDSRTFSCPGGIGDTTVRSGSVSAGLDANRNIPAAARGPVTLVMDRSAAPGGFAGQQAKTATGLSWLPCPEPRARWWFVGAGGLENTHGTVLTISNPRDGEASVDIDVYGPAGLVEAPAFYNIAIPARGSQRIDLAKLAPAAGNLAVSVVATRGLVAVSAVDRFAPGAIGKFAREWLPPQSLPSTSITLAGLPLEKAASALIVANPNEVDAIVKVEVIGQTGTFVPQGLDEFIVAPGSVRSVSMSSVVGTTPMALKVTSEQKITATVRSVKAGDTSFATGVQVIRGGATFAVPDGRVQMLLSSLDQGASFTVRAFGSGTKELLSREINVGAQTTVQFGLPAGTRYVGLVAAGPDLVAGFVAVGKGRGIAAAGVLSAVRSVRLPKVRAGF